MSPPTRAKTAQATRLEVEWRSWLRALFAPYVAAGFAPHHEQIWDWLWAIAPGARQDPLVAILARGGAKSTTAELGCVAVAARRSRVYGLYISATQDQADDHVGNVASMLESPAIARAYPQLGDRLVGKYGSSKGWRRNRVRTASGFTLDAIGLDTASRGKKLDEERPDFLIIDDVDEKHDTERATQKKIDTLTTSILPAGSADMVVLAIQNLMLPEGIFARLADGRADFLAGRVVIGPIRAAENLTYIYDQKTERYRVTGGEPTWPGQDLAVIEAQINTWGLTAFLAEAQHEVNQDPTAGIFKRAHIAENRVRRDEVPELVRVVVGVDPSGSAKGDDAGIVVAGRDRRGHAYVLADRTLRGGPDAWALATWQAYDEYSADLVVAETNYGGEMVEKTLKALPAAQNMAYKAVHASRGKAIRAEPIALLYAEHKVHHAGMLPDLENEMCRWIPTGGMDSPGRMDAAVWALTELMLGQARPTVAPQGLVNASKWRV